MTLKTSPVAPSLIRSSVIQPQKDSATHAEILEMVAQLRRERQAQAQFNHHARLCKEECEQYAAIAAHHAEQAQRSVQQIDRTARSMPDPLAIILISIGTSLLISLAINHLSNQHEHSPSPNIRTERTRTGG